MRKTLSVLSLTFSIFLLFIMGSNYSSCTKKTTTIVTDTVVKTVRDTIVKTVRDTVNVTDTIPAINLKQGLVAYYPFNGNVNDSSGNNNNGTVFGNLQYSTDKSSKAGFAAQFDGSTSYVLVNDNGSLSTNSLSISVQFYCNNNVLSSLLAKIQYANSDGAIYSVAPFAGNSSVPGDISFSVKAPGVDCNVSDAIQTSDLVFAMETLQVNTWYQMTVVFDQGKQKIFMNGVLRNAVTRSFTTPKQCTQSQLVMGAFWQNAPYFFNGKMDELRIYNRALNYREIQQLAAGF